MLPFRLKREKKEKRALKNQLSLIKILYIFINKLKNIGKLFRKLMIKILYKKNSNKLITKFYFNIRK